MKSTQELVLWLIENVKVREIAISDFSEGFRRHLFFNAAAAASDRGLKLSHDEYQFRAYRIDGCEQNRRYVCRPLDGSDGYPFLYVVFELRTGWMCSNDNKLLLTLIVERGASEESRRRQDTSWREYETARQWLKEGAY